MRSSEAAREDAVEKRARAALRRALRAADAARLLDRFVSVGHTSSDDSLASPEAEAFGLGSGDEEEDEGEGNADAVVQNAPRMIKKARERDGGACGTATLHDALRTAPQAAPVSGCLQLKRWWLQEKSAKPVRALAFASVGSYGAALADGSEYRGEWGLPASEYLAFHRPRLEVLCEAFVSGMTGGCERESRSRSKSFFFLTFILRFISGSVMVLLMRLQ